MLGTSQIQRRANEEKSIRADRRRYFQGVLWLVCMISWNYSVAEVSSPVRRLSLREQRYQASAKAAQHTRLNSAESKILYPVSPMQLFLRHLRARGMTIVHENHPYAKPDLQES
jgi:hypothetical protein